MYSDIYIKVCKFGFLDQEMQVSFIELYLLRCSLFKKAYSKNRIIFHGHSSIADIIKVNTTCIISFKEFPCDCRK